MKFLTALIVTMACAFPVFASLPDAGTQHLYLQQKDGSEQKIGKIIFTGAGEDTLSYRLELDHHLFKTIFSQ